MSANFVGCISQTRISGIKNITSNSTSNRTVSASARKENKNDKINGKIQHTAKQWPKKPK